MTTESNSQNKPHHPRALNAFKHGLTGQVHLLSAVDQAAYDQHCRETRDYFRPAPGFETSLVQSIADDRWQLQRAAAIDDNLFACGVNAIVANGNNRPEVEVAIAATATWLTHEKSLERLTLYTHRIQRRMEKNVAMLRQFQADRKAAFEKALDDAATLLQLAEEKGETIDLATDFPPGLLPPNFDFSSPEIVRLIAHRRALDRAKHPAAEPQKRFPAAA